MPFTPFYSTNYSASVDQGGNILTHSFSERLTDIAEFDDALIDQKAWKNSRYEGSKLIGKKINNVTKLLIRQKIRIIANLHNHFV